MVKRAHRQGPRQRQRLLAKLPDQGQILRGSLVTRYRRCGKAGCHCAGTSDRTRPRNIAEVVSQAAISSLSRLSGISVQGRQTCSRGARYERTCADQRRSTKPTTRGR